MAYTAHFYTGKLTDGKVMRIIGEAARKHRPSRLVVSTEGLQELKRAHGQDIPEVLTLQFSVPWGAVRIEGDNGCPPGTAHAV